MKWFLIFLFTVQIYPQQAKNVVIEDYERYKQKLEDGETLIFKNLRKEYWLILALMLSASSQGQILMSDKGYNPPADVFPPSVPSGLRGIAISDDSLLFYGYNSPEGDLSKYVMWFFGAVKDSTSNDSIYIGGLKPNTTYGLAVLSVDASGNRSNYCDSLQITTLDTVTAPYESVYYFHPDSTYNTASELKALVTGLGAGDTVVLDGINFQIDEPIIIDNVQGTADNYIVFQGRNNPIITTRKSLYALTWSKVDTTLWFDKNFDGVEIDEEKFRVGGDTIWQARFIYDDQVCDNFQVWLDGRCQRFAYHVPAYTSYDYNAPFYNLDHGFQTYDGTWWVNNTHRYTLNNNKRIIYLYSPNGLNPNTEYSSIEFTGQVAYSGRNQGENKSTVIVRNSSYVKMDSLHIEGGLDVSLNIMNTDHFWIEDSYIGKDNAETGMAVNLFQYGVPNTQNSDSGTIKRCYFISGDSLQPTTSNNYLRIASNAIDFSVGVNSVNSHARGWVIDSSEFRYWHMGIHMVESITNLEGLTGQQISNNYFNGNGTSYFKPLQLYGVKNVHFYNNLMDSMNVCLQVNGTGTWIDTLTSANSDWFGNRCDSLYVYYNIWNNSNFCDTCYKNVHDSKGDAITYQGITWNEWDESSGAYIEMYDSIPTNFFFNNTFYTQVDNVIDVSQPESYAKIYFNNNLLLNNNSRYSYEGVFQVFKASYHRFKNNLFGVAGGSSSLRFVKTLKSPTTLYTVAEWNALNGTNDNEITGNLFSSSAYNTIIDLITFEAVTGSSVLNGGIDVDALLPDGFTDRLGNVVNQATPNIGAIDNNP